MYRQFLLYFTVAPATSGLLDFSVQSLHVGAARWLNMTLLLDYHCLTCVVSLLVLTPPAAQQGNTEYRGPGVAAPAGGVPVDRWRIAGGSCLYVRQRFQTCVMTGN